eukprot:SAG31_NODE_13387_length_873_cov_0.877261_2_plen_126_part_00
MRKPTKDAKGVDIAKADTGSISLSFSQFLLAMQQAEAEKWDAEDTKFFETHAQVEIFRTAVEPIFAAMDTLQGAYEAQGGKLLRHRLRFVNYRILQLLDHLDIGACECSGFTCCASFKTGLSLQS